MTSGIPRWRRPSSWIALTAAALLVSGLAVAMRQWRPEPASRTTVADPSDGTIEQALRQIPAAVDSAELKSRWTERARGVDLTRLDPERHEIFLRFANSERCTCGCGYTLAACREYDLTCPVSLPRVQALLDSVRTGRIRSAEGLRERPREAVDSARERGIGSARRRT